MSTATRASSKPLNVSSWSPNETGRQLSNFAPARFTMRLDRSDLERIGFLREEIRRVDGIVHFDCGSVEGLVQSLKAESIDSQEAIARLSGKDAKTAGKAQIPEIRSGTRIVFFAGKALVYASHEHCALIEHAIVSRFAQDDASRAALVGTGDVELTHNLGKYDAKPGQTSLPKQVFVRILTECRSRLQSDEHPMSFGEILDRIRSDSLDERKWYRAA